VPERGDNIGLMQRFVSALASDEGGAEHPYELAGDREQEYRRTLGQWLDPAVEVDLCGFASLIPGMREHYEGAEGWWGFWFGWLESWEGYVFSTADWDEVGGHVLVDVDIVARGRQSGVPVEALLTQVWTLDGERIRRLRIFPSRRRALAALERETRE
jgi:hypothetical protein